MPPKLEPFSYEPGDALRRSWESRDDLWWLPLQIVNAMWSTPVAGDQDKWLHIVEDPDLGLVMSVENASSDILVASLDPSTESSFSGPSWSTLVTFADFATLPGLTGLFDGLGNPITFTGLADHWHCYVDGAHWVVCSITASISTRLPDGTWVDSTQSLALGLVKFTSTVAGAFVVDSSFPLILFAPKDSDFDSTTNRPLLPTNDMCMSEDDLASVLGSSVPVPALAIHIYHPATMLYDVGTRVLRMATTAFSTTDTVDLWPTTSDFGYGHATLAHTNGCSALRRDEDALSEAFGVGAHGGVPWGTSGRLARNVLVAPTSMSPTQYGDILRITCGPDWEDPEVTLLHRGVYNGYAYSMPMQVRVDAGTTVLVYKVMDVVSDIDPKVEDYGRICLEVWIGDSQAGDTLLLAEVGNRPHLIWYNGYLVVGWDTKDTSSVSGTRNTVMQVFTLERGLLPG